MIKDGSVYLNGNLLDESAYLTSDVKTYEGAFLSEGQTITVPANEYFVLGDNRPEAPIQEPGDLYQEIILSENPCLSTGRLTE